MPKNHVFLSDDKSLLLEYTDPRIEQLFYKLLKETDHFCDDDEGQGENVEAVEGDD